MLVRVGKVWIVSHMIIFFVRFLERMRVLHLLLVQRKHCFVKGRIHLLFWGAVLPWMNWERENKNVKIWMEYKCASLSQSSDSWIEALTLGKNAQVTLLQLNYRTLFCHYFKISYPFKIFELFRALSQITFKLKQKLFSFCDKNCHKNHFIYSYPAVPTKTFIQMQPFKEPL